MAKDVQFKVTVDTSQAVKNLAQYRDVVAGIDEEIKNLRKQMKEEGADTKKIGEEIARLTEQKKAYNKEIANTSRELQNNLVAASDKYEKTLKGMRAQLSAAKDALAGMALGSAEYAEQAANVKKLNDEVKELEQEYGVFTRSVGDYENAIKNALRSTSPMVASIADIAEESGDASTILNNVGGALKNLGKAGLALLANPVFAVLAGLAAVFLAIKKAINSSEEATARWNAALAPLNRALDWLLSVAQKAAGVVLSAFEAAANGIDWVMSKLEKIPGIGDIFADINAANKEAIQLEKDKYELTKRTREDEVANAKAAFEVSKLRTQAKDKEKYTAAERLRFVQEAARIEEDIAKRNVEREKEKLRLMEIEASWAENDAETNDALAQQEAAIWRARTEYQNKTRELLEQETAARNEMSAEAKAALDAVYNAESRALDMRQQLILSQNQFDQTYLYDYTKSAVENAELRFQHEQIWAAKTLQLQQALQKQKLELQLKYGKITQDEYNAQMQLLRDEESQFQLEQMADIEARAKELHDAMIELAGGLSVDAQIRDLEEQYRQAFETLKNDANMAADERAYYELMLTEQLAKRKQEIMANSESATTTNIKEERQKQFATIEEYGRAVMDMVASFNDLFTSLSDAERQRAEENNEAQKDALKKRLDSGLISQKKYDKEVEKADKELAEKKARIAREEAMRERALSLVQIAWSTAEAIMNIWATASPFAAPALTALASAMGAAQIAAVMAAPVPTARKGGAVAGRTHENGGVLMELENEERIVGAKPSKAFPELLNLISYIGKNASIPDTGYAARILGDGGSGSAGNINADVLAQKIGEQVGDVLRQAPIYLSLTELREEQEIMARVENSARM
ncbi:MAG: hypothetical protein U0L52_04480 [Bacteroidaceae bacterium]|nr:hypothetical protein [Bacteroidaceae bacterium]